MNTKKRKAEISMLDEEGLNKKDTDAAILLQYKVLKLIRENEEHVVFSVMLGLLLKPMIVGGTKKEAAMKVIDEAWDAYEKEYKRQEEDVKT